MIDVKIPGWKHLIIEQVLCDFNGTLAEDGILVDGVAERLKRLAEFVKIILLTADTHGTAASSMADLPVEVKVIDPGQETMAKGFEVEGYGTMTTAFIGNGANDEKALKQATLGIAVLGKEGAFSASIQSADLVVQNPLDALDLLLIPKRLVAGLRR